MGSARAHRHHEGAHLKRKFARSLAAALVVAFAALGSSARAADPYEIDVILALTGPLALIGNDEQTSLRIEEGVINKAGGINGRPVHFAIQDDQSQPALAVQLANAIVAKGAPVMLGPTYAASCLAVAPLVRANGPVDYCFAPAIHPVSGGYTFSSSVSTLDQTIAMLNFAKSKGWKRVAALSTTDATGVDGEQQLKVALGLPQFSGMELAGIEHYALSDVSAAAQAARVKALNPDIIILTMVGTPTGTALRSLKDAGLDDTPVMANFGNLIHAELNGFANFIPQNMYLTAPRFVTHDVSRSGPVRDAQLAFYRAFAEHAIDPDVPHNLSWDPVMILVQALRTLGPTATAKQVLDYLEPLHGVAGTNGIFDYRGGSQRGLGLSSVVVVKWDAVRKNWSTISDIGGKARVK
jgi:branched-chain amino acid transport system substrate-binding protein